ncbi:MAG: cell division protein ZapA [Caulobacterales bacterium]|nr:cell division protein ZapA [Caulobacterales bacterium]
MATVTVDINGRPYAVGCADGQEERVRILARQFDAHVRQVGRDVGNVGDIRLFLMAALVLADELQEARLAQPASPVLNGAATTDGGEAGVAEALNAVAARIEKIAQSL